jgi:cyanophycinase
MIGHDVRSSRQVLRGDSRPVAKRISPLSDSHPSPNRRRPFVCRSLVHGAALLLLLVPHIAFAQAASSPRLPEPAEPIQGSLVICGGAALPPEVIQRFVELAGGAAARLVVIPTATGLADIPDELEPRIAIWKQQSVKELTFLHTRSPDIANEPEFCAPLARATGVWFVGGVQSRITDAYLGTLAERELHGILRRGGVIGGTSAGAAIMTEVMIRRGIPNGVDIGKGFGFFPNAVIDQHFLKRNRQARLMSVLSDHPGCFGLGIDEETAVVAQDQKLSVIGNSQAVVCFPSIGEEPAELVSLKSGDEANFVTISERAVARAKTAATLIADKQRSGSGSADTRVETGSESTTSAAMK